ncbi:hypothetical protein Tco_1025509, partial [Tanacetum coccineum]
VMAIFVISVSSDLSEESVGTSTGRDILFGTIPTTIPDTTPSVIPPTTYIHTAPIPTVSPTIPPSPDYTPASPDYSPASDTEFDPSEDPSSDHIPPLRATLPFLSSTDDSSDTSGALRRRVMVLAPGQPIPHGRPVHMMTARKRVGPLPTHRLGVRHSVDYSSLDHFSLDDSSRDSSSSSSSKTSSDSSMDTLSDSASSRLSFDHSLPTPSSDHLILLLLRVLLARGVDPLQHLYRYLHLYLEHCIIHVLIFYDHLRGLGVRRQLGLEGLGVDFEDESFEPSRSRGIDLEVDVEVVRNDGIDIDPKTQAEINECPVEVRVDRVTHPVVADDIPEPTQEGVVEVTYETLGDLVQRIIATRQQSADMLEKIKELERDNMRLRDMMDVASQRVVKSQHRELHVQREMRQIWRFRFYDRMRIARLEACARRHLGYCS